jgi:hypothetical protein
MNMTPKWTLNETPNSVIPSQTDQTDPLPFSEALRRLTRIHVRSVEQPYLDEGYQYDWPWMYAVEVGHWNMHADNPESPAQFSALGIRIGFNYVAYAMTH